jgi:benzoyl-CoA reductase/2-hydroxyglutaryl-CoA dehydratase subunit BcrC/BadD/HgdB
MKVDNIQLNDYREMVTVLEAMLNHRRSRPTYKADELYYELLHKYHQRVLRAAEQGNPIIAHTTLTPSEILYAMDLVPLHLENTAMAFPITLGRAEECLNVARSFGLTVEVCSAHRLMASLFIKHWVPPVKAVIWSNQVCDNTAKCGDIPREFYGQPGFFLDVPYRSSPREVSYIIKQLRELIRFLEEVTDRHLDEDRLKEAVSQTREVIQLQREINELSKVIPMPNRIINNLMTIGILYYGSTEAVNYYRETLELLKEWKNKGTAPQPVYRLLALFIPPQHSLKVVDWMEKEFGAYIITNPYCVYWGELEMDPERPLESIARKCMAAPICYSMLGPADAGVVEATRESVREYNLEGAIYWAHIGCRQACALIRTMKDTLKDMGIPMVTLDIDLCDPSYTSNEELQDKLEEFFEILESSKAEKVTP